MKRIFKDKIMYFVNDGQYSIYFLTDDETDLTSTLDLFMDSDFSISSFTKHNIPKENGKLELKIDSTNLFYNPLVTFLRDDNEIIIEDDMTPADFGKKATFSRYDESIIVTFEYIKEDLCSQFSINIKNILRDGRSKIDQQSLDTKDRLHGLFRDLHDVFRDYNMDESQSLQKKLNRKNL